MPSPSSYVGVISFPFILYPPLTLTWLARHIHNGDSDVNRPSDLPWRVFPRTLTSGVERASSWWSTDLHPDSGVPTVLASYSPLLQVLSPNPRLPPASPYPYTSLPLAASHSNTSPGPPNSPPTPAVPYLTIPPPPLLPLNLLLTQSCSSLS